MNFYDFTVRDDLGRDVPLSWYSDKVVIVVNTAAPRGLELRYAPLETMYEKYHGIGLEIIGIPCGHPVYTFLKEGQGVPSDSAQFVIDRSGRVAACFETGGDMKDLENCVKSLL